MSGGRDSALGDDRIVVVPPTPGRLVRPGAEGGRGRDGRDDRDDLDELIDDLLPDSTEGPGVIDAALVAGGSVVVGWSLIGSPPVAATVAGIGALGLGCILPLRAGWRRLTDLRRARRRAALLACGTPVRTSDPAVARLVGAYEQLGRMTTTPDAAQSAAHGALLEVATLLEGRVPASDRERGYVEARAAAVEALVGALGEIDAGSAPTGAKPRPLEPDLVVEAREELDALGGVSSLSRLDELTAEMRDRGRHR